MSKKAVKEKKGKYKTPATEEKGYKVVHDFQYKRVYLYTSPRNPQLQWWVIESKLYANLPVKKSIRISLDGMYWEQGVYNDEPVEIRIYYPVNRVEKADVLKMADSDNRALEREYKRYKKFKKAIDQ